jgi:hypothetical protein
MKQRIRQMNLYQEKMEHYGMPVTVYYSYYTPIIVEVNGIMFTSPIKYSRTTSKQKSGLLTNKVAELPHTVFVMLLEALGVERGLA